MSNLKDLMTVKQAAEYLGVSNDTVRRWCDTSRLDHTRHPVNGYRLFNRKTLDKLLAKVQRPS
jgi:DNA repair protein RadD